MSFRVTNNSLNARLAMQIQAAQNRVANAQEQVTTGKKINAPSDDPSGSQRLVQLRSIQASVDQFRRNASATSDKLTFADGAISSYEQVLDRTRTLVSQGASDSTTPSARAIIATNLESIKSQIMAIANGRSNDEYIFGGTQQTSPPFDTSTEALSAIPTASQRVQIEPSTPAIESGVTANTVFSDASGTVIDTINSAITALRGTGDPVADDLTLRTSIDRLSSFSNTAGIALTRIGSNLSTVQTAQDRLNSDYLALEGTASQIESADAAGAMIALTSSSNSLTAIIQTGAFIRSKSLIDMLG